MQIRTNVVMVSVAMLVVSWSAKADQANAEKVAAALFDAYCLKAAGGFEDLDKRATDAHHEVVMDRSLPMPDGAVMRQKNWLVRVSLATGAPIVLTSNDVTNGLLQVFGCGIFGPALDGNTMESALSSLERPGAPAKHAQVSGGSAVVTWLARVGEKPSSVDAQVMMSPDTPGMSGVIVNLILKTQLNEASH